MNRYLCDDGNAEIEIQAESARDAAQEYVGGGDWGEINETTWVKVYVQAIDDNGEEVGDRDSHKISIDPSEPACEGSAHDWQSPHSVVGGLEENPGVWGSGGGVTIREVCAHCGMYRIRDTWAQDMQDGEQGLESVKYEDADEASEEWVESLREDDE